MQKDLKTIRISVDTHAQLMKLKASLNRPIMQITEELIRYAYKLKIDPRLVKEGNPAAETKKLRNDLIAFIKTQESKMIKPMIETVDLAVSKVNAIASTIPDTESSEKWHSKTRAGINLILKKTEQLDKDLAIVKQNSNAFRTEKENYKRLVGSLFLKYIEDRKAFGAFNSGRKVEELSTSFLAELRKI